MIRIVMYAEKRDLLKVDRVRMVESELEIHKAEGDTINFTVGGTEALLIDNAFHNPDDHWYSITLHRSDLLELLAEIDRAAEYEKEDRSE